MDLTGVAREAFGGGRRLAGTERLRGGSKKGVHRLPFEDSGTAVAYVWSAAENHWPGADEPADDADPLAHASGIALFGAAHRRLTALGVRTPRVHLLDGSRTRFPADVAVVEDVNGLGGVRELAGVSLFPWGAPGRRGRSRRCCSRRRPGTRCVRHR